MYEAMTTIVLYGAGGHAAVVLAAAEAAGASVDAILDDGIPAGTSILTHSVRGGKESLEHYPPETYAIHVGIGNNTTRRHVAAMCREKGFSLATICHPAAWCEKHTDIDPGTFIAAHAFIGVRTHIEEGCIINTAATIDHDCYIGPYTHVCPGVHIAGDVRIGSGTLIGTGTSIIPGITIGANCTIGAGAAVVTDVPDGTTVVGVPARIKHPHS